MPEGDTVYRAAAQLDRALRDAVLTTVDLRVPRWATVDLAGARHVATVPRGKHLLTRLSHPSGDVTLHTHLKMEGVWQVHRPGGRWRRPAHEARVVLRSADVEAVGFALGTVDLVPTADEDEVVGHLGPDLLDPAWGPGHVAAVLERMEAEAGRSVREVLLDQRVLAGVGNVFANELCFVSGLHPDLRVDDVPRPQRLVELAERMLHLNRDRTKRVTTGDAHPGRALWVYGRAGKACRRCGTTVRMDHRGDSTAPVQGERSVYWCPRCQPEPAHPATGRTTGA